MPVPFAGVCPFPCLTAGTAKRLQIFKPGLDTFPLFPNVTADFTLYPSIGLLYEFLHICNGIVVQPACCILPQFLQHVLQTASLVSAGQLADFILEAVYRLLMYTDSCPTFSGRMQSSPLKLQVTELRAGFSLKISVNTIL